MSDPSHTDHPVLPKEPEPADLGAKFIVPALLGPFLLAGAVGFFAYLLRVWP